MYAVMHRYANAEQLAEIMLHRDNEVRRLIGSVPGFIAYYAFRNGDQLVSVTVCSDEAGTEESTEREKEWVRQMTSEGAFVPPEVSQGETFLKF